MWDLNLRARKDLARYTGRAALMARVTHQPVSPQLVVHLKGGLVSDSAAGVNAPGETPSLREIALLKLDVEGAELDALRGLGDADWSRVRQVVVEAHDGGEGRVAALEALLRARGFEVRCVPSRHAPATDWMLYARRSPAHSDTPTPDVGGAAAR